MGRPAEWWPVSESDPVPGDPETLAAFGRKMGDVAAAIEQLATTLPRLASSQEWDSEAGDAFRTKTQSFATTVGKSRARFTAVATALGTSTYGGGYAAALQSCQDEADAQIRRVTGPSGSEAARLRAWGQLVAATGGLSPEHPVPKPGSSGGTQRVPAGAYPAASPRNTPPDLPDCAGDSAQVAALKGTYNEALGTLRSAAAKISQAASEQAAAAQHAASVIRNAIDNDGLNNPTGLHALWHDATSFFDDHVVGVLKAVSEIAGLIASACGIIALVLAFIPGMQAFAAAFETLSLLATAVQLISNLVLAATGHGSWIAVGLDAIALATMGAAKGLGTAAEDASTSAVEDGLMAHAEGDPLRVLGSALETQPEEVKAAFDAVESAGGEVILRPGSLGYAPAPGGGRAGQLIFDPEGSYGALLHEMSHFTDDQVADFPGWAHWYDNNGVNMANSERAAYQKEIDYALSKGLPDIASQLQQLMAQRLADFGI